MILPLLTENSPLLHQVSEKVKDFDQNLEDLWRNLEETAKFHNAVGIASVQCGIPKKIILVSSDGEDFKLLINPVIVEEYEKQTVVEGCLSLPGRECIVSRPFKVLCKFQDLAGNKNQIVVEGLLAAVISHEVDHCLGITMDFKHLTHLEKFFK